MEHSQEVRIGKRLSPILESIEDALWEWEYHDGRTPDYTDEGFRGAVKIFMSAMMDKMWKLQQIESFDFKDRVSMVEKCGDDIRNLVKVYTDIDTQKLYE